MKSKNVIIGGGITGMYLAYRLARRGENVIVLEKSDKLGGLLKGFKIGQNTIEETYHHLFAGDRYAVDLINELDLGGDLGWYKSSMSIYYKNKFYPFGGAVDLLKFDAISFINRIRSGIISLYLSKTKAWHKFELVPAYKYMKKLYGHESYRVIWLPLLKSKFGNKYKQVSMAWMWARLNSRGNSKKGGVEKLGYLMGGFGKIVDVLEKEVKAAGGKIMTGVKLKKIEKTKDKLNLIMSDKKIEADRIFCCIDNDSLAKLLDSKKYKNYKNKLRHVNYLGTINLVFRTKQDLTPYYWNNINDMTCPFVAFVKHTQLVDKKKYNDDNVYYLGTYINVENDLYKKDRLTIKKIFFAYLKKIVCEFDQNKVSQTNVFKYPKSQHLVGVNYAKKLLPLETEIEGVYLINYSQIYPKDRGINWSIKQVDELLTKIK